MARKSAFTLPQSLEYNGVKMILADQDEARTQNAINYLLSYGWAKSLQDSVAGLKKLLSTEPEKLSDRDRETVAEIRQDYPTQSVAEIISAEMALRAEAIFAGTVGTRGTRLTGPDAIRRVVIDEYFKAWAKSQADKGKALPSLKTVFNVTAKEATDEQRKVIAEKLSALRARYAEVAAAKIEEEVQRRMAAQAAEVETEIDLDMG